MKTMREFEEHWGAGRYAGALYLMDAHLLEFGRAFGEMKNLVALKDKSEDATLLLASWMLEKTKRMAE